jgi:hypothetical protein
VPRIALNAGACVGRARGRILCSAIVLLSAQAAAQQAPLRTIHTAPTCASCKIVLQQGARLRLPSDSLSFGIGTAFTRVGRGKYIAWDLAEAFLPAVFDSTGRFERLLGREGQGPGEFETIDLVFRAQGDTVWIMDRGRRHVFTPQLRFVRTERTQSVGDLARSSDGRLLLARTITTPERAGYPLHLMNASGELGKAFGRDDPTLDPRRLAQINDSPNSVMHRSVTPGAGNTIWVWSPTRFLLERYDFAGKLLAQGRHELSGWYKEASERRKGKGDFPGMYISTVVASSERNVIWLVYHDPNASYRCGHA